MRFERYAIYWAPRPGSALAEFERRWFGVDPARGAYLLTRSHFDLSYARSCRAVEGPRRYGLHATLKAPFRLRDWASATGLAASIAAFCSRRRRPRAGPLRLTRFERYLALAPDPPLAELDWLAAECTVAFDAFRAPTDEADRARRPADLSPRQSALLEQFGYPYVLDQFQFHVTLAGPLPRSELLDVEEALGPECAVFAREDFAVDGLCLFGDPGGARPFKLIGRWPFLR